MSSQNNFVKGATILAAAGVASRFLGFPLRIILAAIIGAEGIGLYGVAYPVYSSLLVISTAGIPVAISKLVAENITLKDYKEAARVFRISLLMLTITGFVITLLMVGGANFIAVNIANDERAVYPLLVIAPAILFVTIMSALRGFFQGQQQMIPTALSQIVEQAGRVGAALFLAVALLPVGLEYAAAGAAGGAVAGGGLGLIVVALLYWRNRPHFNEKMNEQVEHNPVPAKEIIKRIFQLAIPVTLGGLVMQLINVLDLVIVPSQLAAAGLGEKAMALFGQLTQMASPIVYFPNTVALALSMSLVPAISEAVALRSRPMIANRSGVAIKLITLFAIPAAVGLYQLATPITELLFKDTEAAYPLSVLAWSVIPLCVYVVTTGILQGLGRPIIPVLSMVYGGLVKAVLTYILTGVPSLHIGGAAAASVVSLSVAALFNLYYVARHAKWSFRLKELVILPGISVAVMYVAVHFSYMLLARIGINLLSAGAANAFATMGSILVGVSMYGIILLLTGSIKKDELLMLPRVGKRLVSILSRFGLLR